MVAGHGDRSTGVADVYLDDDAAAAYWGYQQTIGRIGGQLNLWKFADHVRDDHTVLDFGCGGGYLLERLPGSVKVGVEPNRYARAEAERKGIRMYAAAADVPGDSVDVVVSNHALEHVLSPIDELRELYRALHPGGRLVLVVPMIDWRSRTQRRPDPNDPNHEFHTWTPQLLHNLLAEAGFQPRSVRISAHAWHPLSVRLQFLPRPLFRLHAWLIATLLRRREVHAIAEKPA